MHPRSPHFLLLLISLCTFISFATSNSLEDQECDIVLEHGLCLYNGEKLIFADAKPAGLVAHWTFDDYKGLDTSGNHHHASSLLKPGPGIGGQGYSAAVDGKDFITISNSDDFNSNVFSITFWVFLIKEGIADPKAPTDVQYCPLLIKGNLDTTNNEYAQAPAIMLNPKDRTLLIATTTTEKDVGTEGETLTSNSRIPYNKWTHIGLVRLDKKVRLYVNGILDSVIQTNGSTVSNSYPLYIGNAPFAQDQCNIPAYIDELRFYTRELKEVEIEAEASPALGNMHPSYVQLGCMNCGILQAIEACIEGYHLCSTIELHSGVLQIARSLGWTEWNSKIWSYSAIKQTADKSETGLGICCID